MKNNKVLIVMIVFSVLLLAMSMSVCAEGKIFVDLQEVVSDTPAKIINGRTMVPVREITEMLGYDVCWNDDNQQVDICEKDSKISVITMLIDSAKASYIKYDEKSGETAEIEVILDVPATLINGRTFVPLRFISEAVGYLVEYDEESADVFLFSPEYLENHPDEAPNEGVGSVIPLSVEEMEYVVNIKTNDWLAMNKDEKSAYVELVGRWWEDYENRIVEDYDNMVKTVDHQMEQYYRYDVNEFVFLTICEIYEVDKSKYIIEMFE